MSGLPIEATSWQQITPHYLLHPMIRNDRAIVALTSVGHGMVHTYELSIPILMTLWLAEFDVSTAVLGGIVAIGYGLYGLGALPAGILADRWGSRRLIVGCLAGMGSAFLLLSLAPGLWTIAAALVLWGLAASLYHPAGLTLISRGVVQRGKGLALHGMAGNIGIAMGPLCTALLLLVVDWRVVAGVLAIPALIATGYAAQASFDETAADAAASAQDRSPDSFHTLWTTTRVLFASGFALVFLIVMMSGLYYRGVLTFLPDLLERFVTIDLGLAVEPGRYVYAALLMVGMMGQYIGGWLTDHVRTERGILGAFVLLTIIGIAFWPLAQAGAISLFIISGVLGIALFMIQPLYQATVAEYTPPAARGLSYGFTYLGVFGVGALGAALAGSLLNWFTPLVLFLVLAIVAALGALLSAYLAWRPRRTMTDSSS